MNIMLLASTNKNFIVSYWQKKFLVNDQEYHDSVIIFSKKVIKLKENDINSRKYFKSLFLTEKVEILLPGTSKTHRTLNYSVKSYLIEQNVSFEFMTTASACRTHNILISEDKFAITYLGAI